MQLLVAQIRNSSQNSSVGNILKSTYLQNEPSS